MEFAMALRNARPRCRSLDHANLSIVLRAPDHCRGNPPPNADPNVLD